MLPDRVSNPGPLTYESGALVPFIISVTDIILNFYFRDIIVHQNVSYNYFFLLSFSCKLRCT